MLSESLDEFCLYHGVFPDELVGRGPFLDAADAVPGRDKEFCSPRRSVIAKQGNKLLSAL
jgi:hypothetical protein